MKHGPNLTSAYGERAMRQLMRTLEIFENNNIPYHLEGGTLLGLVREQRLLPWDDDMDISVPASVAGMIRGKVAWQLRSIGLRVSFMSHESAQPAWPAGAPRIVKIRRRRWLFLRGHPCIDVFVKYDHAGQTWWTAKRQLMQVPAEHYDGSETIQFGGRKLRVPVAYERYLELKYGDWRVPVKNWNCAEDERTIVGQI